MLWLVIGDHRESFLFFLSLSFVFFSQYVWVAGVCRLCFCRIWYDDGMALRCLLSLLHYNVLTALSLSSFCDHIRACISLGGRIRKDTGCAGCRRVQRTIWCEQHTPASLCSHAEESTRTHAGCQLVETTVKQEQRTTPTERAVYIPSGRPWPASTKCSQHTWLWAVTLTLALPPTAW